MISNVKSVLGPNPLLWLWPQAMQGDGLLFPVNPDAGGESAPHQWAGTVAREEGHATSTLPNGFGNGEERLRHARPDVDGDMV